MPALGEGRPAPLEAAASAPLELMWLLHFLEAGHEHEGAFASLEPLRVRFGPELSRLRGDGLAQYSTELVVLAWRAGALLDLELDRFFSRFDETARGAVRLPSLRSERANERDLVAARLERLRSDAGMRKVYRTLLADVWDAVGGEWRETGRPAAVAEALRWSRALGDGAGYRDVLGLARLWPGRSELDDMADAAAADGSLILTPCWFGGKVHIVDLDGAVYVGRGIRHGEPSYRRVAAEISSNLRALADPTRLAILLRLARQPASVTELARQFKLSQPTVSAHVQILRDAGLLEERAVGRSAELSASEDALRRLFSSTEEALVRLYRS